MPILLVYMQCNNLASVQMLYFIQIDSSDILRSVLIVATKERKTKQMLLGMERYHAWRVEVSFSYTG